MRWATCTVSFSHALPFSLRLSYDSFSPFLWLSHAPIISGSHFCSHPLKWLSSEIATPKKAVQNFKCHTITSFGSVFTHTLANKIWSDLTFYLYHFFFFIFSLSGCLFSLSSHSLFSLPFLSSLFRSSGFLYSLPWRTSWRSRGSSGRRRPRLWGRRRHPPRPQAPTRATPVQVSG